MSPVITPREGPGHEHVRIASSAATDTRVATTEVLDAVDARRAQFTFLFYSPRHDARVVAEQLGGYVGGRGVGGSTAGEISPQGFDHNGLVALSLHGPGVRGVVREVPQMTDFSLMHVAGIAGELARELGYSTDELDPKRHMWILLLDGLSGREDLFTPFFSTHAPRIPLVGGSLGDEDRFVEVTLASGGRSTPGAGAVVLLEYDRPFEVLHHTHLEFTEHWFEVTSTAPGGRFLLELNGRPALEVYAEALGKDVQELTLDVTGSAPFGFRFKGRPFPCSVMRIQDDRILLAYSVEVGDKLNLLRAVDLVDRTEVAIAAAVDRLRAAGGEPRGMLTFNCLGRYLEARRLNVRPQLHRALAQLPLAGLQTYGEQYGSRHMNHSLTGVLFG